MSRLEDGLRWALRRQEPSPDFTARVLSRLSAAPARKACWWMSFRLAAVAAACVLMALGGLEYRRYHQGQVAKQQVLAALRIAGSKLKLVQQKVSNVSASTKGNL
jgi:hypothetical protein